MTCTASAEASGRRVQGSLGAWEILAARVLSALELLVRVVRGRGAINFGNGGAGIECGSRADWRSGKGESGSFGTDSGA